MPIIQVDIPMDKRAVLGAATRIVNLLCSEELDLAEEERSAALDIARVLINVPDGMRMNPLTGEQQ